MTYILWYDKIFFLFVNSFKLLSDDVIFLFQDKYSIFQNFSIWVSYIIPCWFVKGDLENTQFIIGEKPISFNSKGNSSNFFLSHFLNTPISYWGKMLN